MDNTITETVILETTAVFNEDQTKRYELTKEFKPNKDGKSIVVIMLNAASKNIQETDTTVNNLVNKLSCKELGFKKITILNLFPDIMTKLVPKMVEDLDTNFTYIEEVLNRGYDNILVGYGNSFIGNKIVENAKYRLHQLLINYESILVEISDDDDTYDCSPMHPLFASMRLAKWVLKPYRLPKSELEPIVLEPKKPRKPLKNGLLAEGEAKGDGGKKKAEKT